MEEKYESFKQKILKQNELALRGEEVEAINARKAMDRLCICIVHSKTIFLICYLLDYQ